MRIVSFAGAGATQSASLSQHFALEIYAFAAFGADYPGTLEAGQVFRLDFYLYPFLVEEDFFGELCVGFLLAGVFGHFWEHFAGGLFAGFFGGDADGSAGLQIDEGGGDFTPVAELQGALTQAAVGDQRDRVGDAAIDFYIGDDAFAFDDGVVDAEFPKTEHGQPHAEDLAGAEVAVGNGRQVEIFAERLHELSLAPVASLTPAPQEERLHFASRTRSTDVAGGIRPRRSMP